MARLGATAAPLDLDAVFRQHARQVARWAALLGGPRVEPSDVVQDVFLVVERRLGELRHQAALTTWLYRITAHVVRAHRRKSAFYSFFKESLFRDEESPPETPHEELEKIEARRRVYRVLEQLKEAHREVFVLFELEGVAGSEIARRLGVSEDLVWVRLSRARKEFLAKLEKLERREARP